MSERKFYRNVFSYEVLSEEELPQSLGLDDIAGLTYDGHCSGQFLETTREIVDGPAMAKLLLKQGSDPEFFRLDKDGNDTDGDDEKEEENEDGSRSFSQPG